MDYRAITQEFEAYDFRYALWNTNLKADIMVVGMNLHDVRGTTLRAIGALVVLRFASKTRVLKTC